MIKRRKVNVRVEYEASPVRHVAVQCPSCEKWFQGNDISDRHLCYDYDIRLATFYCPMCNESFGFPEDSDDVEIQESCYPEIYDGVLRKKEVWSAE